MVHYHAHRLYRNYRPYIFFLRSLILYMKAIEMDKNEVIASPNNNFVWDALTIFRLVSTFITGYILWSFFTGILRTLPAKLFLVLQLKACIVMEISSLQLNHHPLKSLLFSWFNVQLSCMNGVIQCIHNFLCTSTVITV